MTDKEKIFKALGDSTRLKIFEMLREGRMCACKLQESFDITQPTLSHHMSVLCNSGLVIATKEGKWTYYSIDCDCLNELVLFLGNTVCRRKK